MINISSNITSGLWPQLAVYAGSKGAVDTITGVLAKELGPSKVRVNGINPGLVENEGSGAFVACRRRPRRKAAKGGRWGDRDSTMILLAYRHGLRAQEIADLEWSQVEDGRTPTLHVTRVKHGRPSAHPIRGDEMRMLRKLPRTTPWKRRWHCRRLPTSGRWRRRTP